MSLSKPRQTKVRQLMRQYLHNVGQLCVVLDKEEKWFDGLKSRPIRKVKVKR